jgi:CheY-like chemotaxis protein
MVTKRKVLVADASKVVRASLAKQLAEHFDVREEASGESAWQTLVLDSAIVGVVAGVNLNRLDGLGLLERVRDSKLARIKSLPFFLVVSSSFGESQRHLARQRGRLILFQRIPAMPRWQASVHSAFSSQEVHAESAEVAIEPVMPCRCQ